MYIFHIILTVFILLFIFFRFVGRRTILFVNGTRINVNNDNNNNNNNNIIIIIIKITNISGKTVRPLLSNNTTHTSGKTNFGEEACQQDY